MKYLVWIALIVLLVFILRPRPRRNPTFVDPHANMKSGSSHEPTPEPMVSCSHCGLHIPASEALKSVSGTLYCSNEHRTLHDKR